MDSKQAISHFREADRLYREQRFGEALAILDLLDDAFPNTCRILFPKARCLSKLFRTDEARDLCQRLVLEYHYEPAKGLLAELDNRGVDLAAPNFDINVEIAALKPEPSQPVTSYEGSTNWRLVIGIAAVVLILGVGIFLLATHRSSDPDSIRLAAGQPGSMDRNAAAGPTSYPETPHGAFSQSNAETRNGAPNQPAPDYSDQAGQVSAKRSNNGYSEKPGATGIPRTIVVISLFLCFQMLPLFLTLWILGKLPSDDVLSNIVSVGTFTVLFLLRGATIIGIIRSANMLIDTYDLGFLEFMLYLFMNFVFWFGCYLFYLNFLI